MSDDATTPPPPPPPPPVLSGSVLTWGDILSVVAGHYGLSVSRLRARERHAVIAHPRAVAMFLCRHMLLHGAESYLTIGRIFGRDHSTVISAVNRIAVSYEEVPTVRAEVDAIRTKLGRPAVRDGRPVSASVLDLESRITLLEAEVTRLTDERDRLTTYQMNADQLVRELEASVTRMGALVMDLATRLKKLEGR